jgi:hypothetical protein
MSEIRHGFFCRNPLPWYTASFHRHRSGHSVQPPRHAFFQLWIHCPPSLIVTQCNLHTSSSCICINSILLDRTLTAYSTTWIAFFTLMTVYSTTWLAFFLRLLYPKLGCINSSHSGFNGEPQWQTIIPTPTSFWTVNHKKRCYRIENDILVLLN